MQERQSLGGCVRVGYVSAENHSTIPLHCVGPVVPAGTASDVLSYSVTYLPKHQAYLKWPNQE
jgi:hypothetical protein